VLAGVALTRRRGTTAVRRWEWASLHVDVAGHRL